MSPTDDSSPFEIAFGAVLEALVPGATVHGVLGAWPVDVVSVRWFGREGILLHYREPNGNLCLLYTSPSPRDRTRSRMPSSA